MNNSFLNNVATHEGWGGGAISVNNALTFDLADSSFVNNLAMGSNATGGAVLVLNIDKGFNIWNTNFANNMAANNSFGGGALSILSADAVNITGCHFSDNTVQLIETGNGGGALMVGDANAFVVEGSRFHNNSAFGESAGGGGAICVPPTYRNPRVCITASNFSNNMVHAQQSQGAGGALYLFHGALVVISHSNFINNTVPLGFGGGIYVFRVAQLQLDANLFLANKAYSGGGLYVWHAADVGFDGANHFAENVASLQGGAVSLLQIGSTHLRDNCTFLRNIAQANGGGAIHFDTCNYSIIASCHFHDNEASSYFGGALYFFNTASSLQDCLFVGNTARDGGAIYYDYRSSYRIDGCTCKDNVAEFGGAVFASGSLDGYIGDSIFLNNTADQLGGGCLLIDNLNGSTTFLRNNTLTDNSAAVGGGIAIWFWSTDTYQSSYNISYRFVGGSFIGNSAMGGSGGAVSIVFSLDAPIPPDTTLDPLRTNQRTWDYTGNLNTFLNVCFIGNTATCSQCAGGALYISRASKRDKKKTLFLPALSNP